MGRGDSVEKPQRSSGLFGGEIEDGRLAQAASLEGCDVARKLG